MKYIDTNVMPNPRDPAAIRHCLSLT